MKDLKPRRSEDGLFYIHPVHYSMHPEKDEAWVAEAKKSMSYDRWQREQEIDFFANTVLVYHEFSRQRHVLKNSWKPHKNAEIFRAMDFGFRHSAVLWIQKTRDGNLIIFDEHVQQSSSVEQLYNSMLAKDKSYNLNALDFAWSSCNPVENYLYEKDLSPVRVLRKHGLKLRYRKSKITTGIELIKTALLDANHQTRLYISPRCQKLISDFQNYHWDLNTKEPVIDSISTSTLTALRNFFIHLL